VVHELEERKCGIGELLVVAPVVLLVPAREPPGGGVEALPGATRQRQGGVRERTGQSLAAAKPAAQRAQERHERADRQAPACGLRARSGHAAASAVMRAAA